MSVKLTNASGPPAGYSNTWITSDPYKVILTVSEDGGSSMNFESTVEETLALNISSQWAAPFENLLADFGSKLEGGGSKAGRIAAAASLATKATGIQVRPKFLTAQIWQSSTPMTLTIPFTFVAINSATNDVYLKVRNLMKLAAPSQDNDLMISAPGPTIVGEAIGGGRKIQLRIGRYMLLEPCVINNVQAQFDNVIGEEGIPLRAKVNVEISSFYTMFTTQDIDSMFLLSKG
jgi:hypothetical protein